MHLGRPISYFSLDWRGLERQCRSLFLCLPFCSHLFSFHMYSLSIFSSLYLPPLCYLSFFPNNLSISLLLIHSLHHYSPFSLCNFFSPFSRDKPQWKRNTALETWQSKRYLSSPSRARWRGLQILYLRGCKHIYQGMNYVLVVDVSAKTCLSSLPIPPAPEWWAITKMPFDMVLLLRCANTQFPFPLPNKYEQHKQIS